MLDKERYRAGAIGRTGKGNFGHGLHLPYKKIEKVDFVAVADPDEKGRMLAGKAAGAERTYSDFRKMLEIEDLDIVSVCPRWVDCHEEMVLACIDSGCHVYCEKPLAISLQSADRMVDAADRRGVKIAVAHQGVYLPQIQKLKRMLEDGQIGTIQTIYAVGKQDSRAGGEDMIVLGTHQFNMMRFFMGDVVSMFARVTMGGKDIRSNDVREAREPVGPIAGDCVYSTFFFQNGVTGFFTSQSGQPLNSRCYGMEIIGTNGRMAVNGGGNHISRFTEEVWAPWEGGMTWEKLEMKNSSLQEEGNQLAILDLIKAIQENRDPISSGRDARAALEMILGAYESQITGSRVIFPMSVRTHPLGRLKSIR